MASVSSATTWGSPTATQHALLIHGLSLCSLTWHRVATSLAAHGYLVTAPNLIGHASRTAPDYHITSFAEDLRPYLEARDYSLIIGHSLGALTTLALFSYLPQSRPIAIVLVDPPLELSPETIGTLDVEFSEWITNVKSPEGHGTEYPLWTREDCIYRELGLRLCSTEVIHDVFRQNRPWNFFKYLDAVPDKWKVTVLAADPAFWACCSTKDLEPYPHIRSVNVQPGIGHFIPGDSPEVIVEETLKTVAALEIA